MRIGKCSSQMIYLIDIIPNSLIYSLLQCIAERKANYQADLASCHSTHINPPLFSARNPEEHSLVHPSEQHLRSPAQSQSVVHSSGLRIKGQGNRLKTGHCPGLALATHVRTQSRPKQHFSPSWHSEWFEQPVTEAHTGVGFRTGHWSSCFSGDED